jgi:regulator of RNase E activity RraA
MKQETLLPEAGSPEAMALLGRCRAIGTATWSDALDQLNIDGVVAADGAEVSAMGGIVALSAFKAGIEGVIIDGACRDIDDIRKGGLWVASRHVTPRTGKRRMRLGGFGEPVLLAGHTVHAGDLVVGDASGLVVVPRAVIIEVLERSELVHHSDAGLERAVASGLALDDAARAASRGVHPVGLHAHPGLRRPSRRGSPWRTDRA